MTLDNLERVLRAFEHLGVDYVLIGGGAVNAHGLIRATEDIDVMVSPAGRAAATLRAHDPEPRHGR